jgi:hypothetical protein
MTIDLKDRDKYIGKKVIYMNQQFVTGLIVDIQQYTPSKVLVWTDTGLVCDIELVELSEPI